MLRTTKIFIGIAASLFLVGLGVYTFGLVHFYQTGLGAFFSKNRYLHFERVLPTLPFGFTFDHVRYFPAFPASLSAERIEVQANLGQYLSQASCLIEARVDQLCLKANDAVLKSIVGSEGLRAEPFVIRIHLNHHSVSFEPVQISFPSVGQITLEGQHQGTSLDALVLLQLSPEAFSLPVAGPYLLKLAQPEAGSNWIKAIVRGEKGKLHFNISSPFVSLTYEQPTERLLA